MKEDLKESSKAFVNNHNNTLEAIKDNKAKLDTCDKLYKTNIKNLSVIASDKIIS